MTCVKCCTAEASSGPQSLVVNEYKDSGTGLRRGSRECHARPQSQASTGGALKHMKCHTAKKTLYGPQLLTGNCTLEQG